MGRAVFWAILIAAGIATDAGTVASRPRAVIAQLARLKGSFELHSRIYPGTVRRYWVYVPEGYDPKRPPNLLLFQDGQRAVNLNGSLRIPAVLDGLIRRRAIPATLGVFVTPGHRATRYPDTLGMDNPDHRVEEYDALSDAFERRWRRHTTGCSAMDVAGPASVILSADGHLPDSHSRNYSLT